MKVNVFDAADPDKLKAAGLVKDGENIIIGGMCNGVAQMVTDINSRLKMRKEKLNLLRIFSHGASGHMQISSGKNHYPTARASINLWNFDAIKADLEKLKNAFDKNGSVELHGCEVGGGDSGSKLLQKLSDLWSVRVTAGVLVQYSGTSSTQLQFEGPTVTAIPGGKAPVRNGEGIGFSQYIYHLKEGEFSKLWNNF